MLGWVGLVLVLVAALAAVRTAPAGSGADDTGPTGGPGAAPTARAEAPLEPPAPVCGSDALDGPAEPPDGAVVVEPDDDLPLVVSESPPGTTFWLAPGRHRLGETAYDSVRPHDGDTFIGAPGAVLDGAETNLYAFTGAAADVRVAHLTVEGFGGRLDNRNQGVVNHDSAPGWVVEHSTLRRNGGAGVFLGSGAVVRHNCLTENGQYGFSAFSPEGPRDVVLHHNEISHNNTADWERRIPTCGCTGGGKFWATTQAVITDNWVHHNTGPGLWADNNNTGFTIEGNLVEHNDAEGLVYETSYNASIVANTFVGNGTVKGPRNPGFPTPAIYVSESGADPRAGRLHGEALVISGNRFTDNWGGVAVWENADRYAGSPANPTQDGTLVNPEVATFETCADPDLIGEDPYYDDCRWKSQHVHVHDNLFELDPTALGPQCTPEKICGVNGAFSNFGTYPPHSPFQGTVIETAVTLEQDNRWWDNTYRGPWLFMAMEAGTFVTWAQWRSEPYLQDAGSSTE
ncbi:lipoprotein [Nocardioides sp. OK12]|nr:lipoprotein [Nocardioides sp. OK12]